MTYSRAELQAAAEERLQDALSLATSGRHSGAFYLAGYAVECALKACIARRFPAEHLPPRDAQKFYVHKLDDLLSNAGLAIALTSDSKANLGLARSWNVVRTWNVDSRYLSGSTQADTEAMLEAITNVNDGIMSWLRIRW